MDWATLAGQVAGFGAPILGRVLGGAMFGAKGAEIGATAGAWLANALGTEATPAAVAAAINNDPQASEKIKQAEAYHRDDLAALLAQLDAENKDMAQVNDTIRAEVASPNCSVFVSWARPACIWAVAVVTVGYGLCVVMAALRCVISGDAAALVQLVQLAPVLGVALAPCGAVAGVTAWGRTKEKIAGAVDGMPPVVTVPVGRAAITTARKT